jgi:hypothetical protein
MIKEYVIPVVLMIGLIVANQFYHPPIKHTQEKSVHKHELRCEDIQRY